MLYRDNFPTCPTRDMHEQFLDNKSKKKCPVQCRGFRKFRGEGEFGQFSKFQGGVEEFSGSREGDGLCQTMTFSTGVQTPRTL